MGGGRWHKVEARGVAPGVGALVLMASLVRRLGLEVVEAGRDGEPRAAFYVPFSWVGAVFRHQHSHPTVVFRTAPSLDHLVILRHPQVSTHLVPSPGFEVTALHQAFPESRHA